MAELGSGFDLGLQNDGLDYIKNSSYEFDSQMSYDDSYNVSNATNYDDMYDDTHSLNQLYPYLVYFNYFDNKTKHRITTQFMNITGYLNYNQIYNLLKNFTKERPTNDTAPQVYSQLYDVPAGIVVLLSIFYGVISLVAVVGNVIVMWVVATSKMLHQSVINFFIANLALADIIIGLFSIPFQVRSQVKSNFREVFGTFGAPSDI